MSQTHNVSKKMDDCAVIMQLDPLHVYFFRAERKKACCDKTCCWLKKPVTFVIIS